MSTSTSAASATAAAVPETESGTSTETTAGHTGTEGNVDDGVEADLRKTLRMRLHNMYRRGPLDPTYKHLLQRTTHNSHVIKFPRDKLYKKVGAEMRRSVESYLANPAASSIKRGRDREDLEDGPMRTAFTLRECKKHEQEALVSIAVRTDVHAGPAVQPPFAEPTPGQILARKHRLEVTAAMLQEQERAEQRRQARIKSERARAVSRLLEKERAQAEADVRKVREERGRTAGRMAVVEVAAAAAEEGHRRREEELRLRQERVERELAQKEREVAKERARERERERELAREAEEAERKARLEREREEAARRARMAETPRQALRRLIEPIFQALWNMEFEYLHRTNPFRIVIDAENCEMMGVPDYCTVIERPMNLTYIKDKVQNEQYESLQQFSSDVELLIKNALHYNSDPTNPYHLAAKEMKRKYKKIFKRIMSWQQQQKQQQEQQQGAGT